MSGRKGETCDETWFVEVQQSLHRERWACLAEEARVQGKVHKMRPEEARDTLGRAAFESTLLLGYRFALDDLRPSGDPARRAHLAVREAIAAVRLAEPAQEAGGILDLLRIVELRMQSRPLEPR